MSHLVEGLGVFVAILVIPWRPGLRFSTIYFPPALVRAHHDAVQARCGVEVRLVVGEAVSRAGALVPGGVQAPLGDGLAQSVQLGLITYIFAEASKIRC